MSGHFQTHSHRPKNTLNLYYKNVSFPQSVYLSLGPTEEGLWLFNISVNMDRPIIGHLQWAISPEGKHKELSSRNQQ